MTNFYDNKMKHLISLRSSLITVLIVLISGLFGLHLLNLPSPVYWGGLFVGMYYAGVFVVNLITINDKIELTLEEMQHV